MKTEARSEAKVVVRNARASAVRIGGRGVMGGGDLADPTKATAGGIEGGAVLMPGTNEIPAELWEVAKNWPAVAGMVAEGDLEPMGPEGEPLEFLKLREPAALKAVRNCFTVRLLEQWASETKSPRVKQAAAEQLRMINDKIAAAKKSSKRADESEDEDPEA